MKRLIVSVLFASLAADTASAQYRTATPEPTPPPACTVACPAGPQGALGPRGPEGPQGPTGLQGPVGKAPSWPELRPTLDVLVQGFTVTATVPRATGVHDKLLYNPTTHTAVLIVQGVSPRCYQLLPDFHAAHTFSSITIDATRTFTWHDATGFWTIEWPATMPCVPF